MTISRIACANKDTAALRLHLSSLFIVNCTLCGGEAGWIRKESLGNFKVSHRFAKPWLAKLQCGFKSLRLKNTMSDRFSAIQISLDLQAVVRLRISWGTVPTIFMATHSSWIKQGPISLELTNTLYLISKYIFPNGTYCLANPCQT